MPTASSFLVAFPPLLLLAVGLIPDRAANHHAPKMWRGLLAALALALACFALAALRLVRYGSLDVALVSSTWPIPLNFGVYFDSLAAVMSLLISYIGLTIALFAARSLRGEATRGRFARWMAFTLAAVLLMVVARNLAMFAAAWTLTSLGLHRLLTHYPERRWAIWAARKKFLISRLGDVCLFAALALTFHGFGSFDFNEVFARAESAASGSNGWQLSLIAALFVVGAMTKSAQAPFHSWLPDTMETPTPVSALMHAGVINAGGFLVIRLSPVVSQSAFALNFLLAAGAFTAMLGGIVMLTQTSIKRSLAYSTIAQMGFMMMQCGLGAFSAALLHIVAHSAYKAYAFLSAGSVMDAAARMRCRPRARMAPSKAALAWFCALAAVIVMGGVTLWAWRINVLEKPGGALLAFVFTLALTQLVWQSLLSRSWALAAWGVAAACVVSSAYVGAWMALDKVLSTSASHRIIAASWLDVVLMGGVALGFSGVFLLQATANSLSHHGFVRRLYVHAANGFYLDIPARRLTARAWGSATPTP